MKSLPFLLLHQLPHRPMRVRALICYTPMPEAMNSWQHKAIRLLPLRA